MTDYTPPMADTEFVLRHLVGLDEICASEHFAHADADTSIGLLEESGRFFAEVVAPTNQPGDVVGSVHQPDGSVKTPEGFKEAYDQLVAAGWTGIGQPLEFGGGGFPKVVATALQEQIGSANLSFSMCPLLTEGSIEAILHHGDEVMRETYLPKMMTSEWSGTMNLTEPHAGSDVGALTTKAEPNDDGSFNVFGTKIFITFGEHDLTKQIVHLVLARTPNSPPGTKGISLFLVPKFLVGPDGELGERNGVTCVSIEHKMGIKASPTCVLSYGENGGAKGWLVGEEHQGMKAMFTMMNSARLGVGQEGHSLAERAYQQAKVYATERIQGRALGADGPSPIIDHANVRRMLMTMKARIEAMRALILTDAAAIDVSNHGPDEATRKAAANRAAFLTPIVKSWCTEMGTEVTSDAIQVYGGMGYIEETGVAQHYRDCRITAIYEGTNGIQALDLVGRKLPLEGGGVFMELISEMRGTLAQADGAGAEFSQIAMGLADAIDAMADCGEWLLTRMSADGIGDAFAGANPFQRICGVAIGAHLMAKSALTARKMLHADDTSHTITTEFLQDKIVTARFFCEQLAPEARSCVAAVKAGAEDLFAIDSNAF